MCGRFAQATSLSQLARQFGAETSVDIAVPGYNVAPTSTVAVVRIPKPGAVRVMEGLKWGFIPSWAKDPALGAKMANARSETASEKPSFRAALKARRCLIPADGFFEWKAGKTPKLPYYFTLKSGEPLALAGLWERWKPPAGGPEVVTFTLLTVGANELMAAVHDRMPVILPPEDWAAWLDPTLQDVTRIQEFLKPFPSGQMACRMVSTYVNSPRNQGPKCIEPIADGLERLTKP